ncbi:hypothetical protein F383_10655 [Gossypium arboreum]|uniref:Uncharacterized protein n=1 Tax=Gossypium arboreum TaxID=29729 RepID=A0A0B0NUJ7_GOSAR|nr:hypothetical protein F383_10655 [Gossypium arboreum]
MLRNLTACCLQANSNQRSSEIRFTLSNSHFGVLMILVF